MNRRGKVFVRDTTGIRISRKHKTILKITLTFSLKKPFGDKD
jgi:hypothetical protein